METAKEITHTASQLQYQYFSIQDVMECSGWKKGEVNHGALTAYAGTHVDEDHEC